MNRARGVELGVGVCIEKVDGIIMECRDRQPAVINLERASHPLLGPTPTPEGESVQR